MTPHHTPSARLVIATWRCDLRYQDTDGVAVDCGRPLGHLTEACGPQDTTLLGLDVIEHSERPTAPVMLDNLARQRRPTEELAVALAIAIRYDLTGEPISLADIAARLTRSHTAIKATLNNLLDAGLISRRPRSGYVPKLSPSAAP